MAPSFKNSLTFVLVTAREPVEKVLGEKGGCIGGDINCNLYPSFTIRKIKLFLVTFGHAVKK